MHNKWTGRVTRHEESAAWWGLKWCVLSSRLCLRVFCSSKWRHTWSRDEACKMPIRGPSPCTNAILLCLSTFQVWFFCKGFPFPMHLISQFKAIVPELRAKCWYFCSPPYPSQEGSTNSRSPYRVSLYARLCAPIVLDSVPTLEPMLISCSDYCQTSVCCAWLLATWPRWGTLASVSLPVQWQWKQYLPRLRIIHLRHPREKYFTDLCSPAPLCFS